MRNQLAKTRLLVELLESRNLLNGQWSPAIGLNALQVDASTYDDSSVLVRFEPGAVQPGDVLDGGLVVGNALPLVDGLYRVDLEAGVSVNDALATLQGQAGVFYAQPNYRVHVSMTPNDPLYNQQYALHNTGQTGGTPDADIDAPEAWDTFTGAASVIVAVIDTGVDYTHPDLAANMWVNPGEVAGNHVDDDGNGFIDDLHGFDFASNDADPMDDYGHGTHVAGTIGADTDNGIGIAGTAWNVQIMAVKFLDSNGSGTLENAILAINYAVANGATISNNSWGGGGFFGALRDAIQAAGAQDHIFVAAAGNDGINNDFSPTYPGSYELDNIIAVAATDHDDQLAYFSNYGATTVDLGAPGVDILSTLPTSGPLSSPTGYGTLSGTSMATPHVAGVVALVRGMHPLWTSQQVIAQVLSTAEPIPALDGLTVTGGRLNAAAAVTGTPPPDTSGPRVTSSNPHGAVQGPVDSLRVTFNEAIDPATFTLDDIVRFTGPTSDVIVTDLRPVAASNGRAFDLTFASQSELGHYELVLGPDIADVLGNLMNQDRDPVNGEAEDDQYHARFTLSDVLHFTSTDTPVYIDWFWSAASSITIDQDVSIGDLDVTLNITHPYVGDLVTYLVAPDGTYIIMSLFNGDGANFADTTFDDEAGQSINSGSAPFAGSFQPLEPLATFDGRSAQGTWTLWVDNWGFATGWLNSWSMTILPAGGGSEPPPDPPPPPPPPPPENQLPTANDDFADTDEDASVIVDVLANDSDPDGDALSVASIDWIYGGSAFINADQTITFIPDADFNGTAYLGYTISDAQAFASATATIYVSSINDAPIANNDLVRTFRDAALTIYEWDLNANDTDADGDWLSVVSVGNATNGLVSLEFGAIVFTPDPGYAGWAGFDYVVTDGNAFAAAHVDVNIRSAYYFSTGVGGTLTSSDGSQLGVASADIVSLVIEADGTYKYQRFFDGSDVGLTTFSENIDAFTFLSDGSILVSTAGAFTVPTGFGGSISGFGEDVLQFSPWSLGMTTGGYWSIYFDGSDVGLSGTAENVDAVAVLPDGQLLISTSAAFSVPGLAIGGQDEDLIAFTPTSLGSFTAGTWSWYFDGSDVGLASSESEDVDGLFVASDAAGGAPTLYFSTQGNFGVPGLSGAREDIFAFRPNVLGFTTSGEFTQPLTLDGSSFGLEDFNIDGFSLGVAQTQYLAGELSTGGILSKSAAPKAAKSSELDLGGIFAELPSNWSTNANQTFQAIWDWLEYELNTIRSKQK